MARVVKLPTSSLTPNAGFSSGGQYSSLPCAMMPMLPGRAPRPAVATAVSKNRSQVGDAASLQNLSGLVNGTGQRKARETRTKKQLQKPEPLPPSSYDTAWVATVPLPSFPQLGFVNGTGQRKARQTRTKKQLQKPEPSPASSYDTAWVATVPLPSSPQVLPCFPVVPATCPKSIPFQLSMVDVLGEIGISRHFVGEIKSILDVTYSCWLRRYEEIMLDVATCAMAFRVLRMNGYDVSSDDLSHVAEASTYLNDTRSLLELYKASQVVISEDELILDSIGSWSRRLLKEQLSSSALQRSPLFREVEHALNSPFYATLDRLEHKRNIEQFDIMEHQMLKTAYLPRQTSRDLLALGVMDFSTSQSIYQEELQHLDSWVKESRLDQLQFARQKLAYFYLSAAGTIFPPELSDARILWAMNGVLTTVVDDFFDVGGSQEELENLTALVEMWDNKHHQTEYYSEQVEIVFSAIYTSVNQLGAKASAVQGRDVTGHLVEIWQDLLRSMMTEVEWRKTGYVPTPEEYIENAVVTFALGPIVLPALYFVGPKLTESAVRDPEYTELFRLMSTCGRLLNDVQTYEREDNEGKLNSVSLLVLHSGGSMSIEEARRELRTPIDTCRRDMLRLVLREDGVLPRPCKELFWKMCKTCYFFYSRGDAFSSLEEKAGAVNAVIHEPLEVTSNLLFDLSP